jgi:polyisoprenoid-binding protein YceI
MVFQSKIHYVGVILALFITTSSVFAVEDEDLCEPFEEAAIDQSVIAKMLDAAEDGHLYRIKSDSSKMGFCVDSPIGMVSGNFQSFRGGMALKGQSSDALVSIDAGSLETNGALIESLLKGDEFFDIEKYPELIFVGSGTEWLSDTKAVLKGELSMRGVTKPVAFYVEVTEVDGELGDSETVLIKATTTLLRSEFGMRTLSPMVSDKVNLCMSVEAERYKS